MHASLVDEGDVRITGTCSSAGHTPSGDCKGGSIPRFGNCFRGLEPSGSCSIGDIPW